MSVRQRRASSSSTSTTAALISSTAQKIEQKVESALTVLWNDLPSWQQDNQYIQSGYRAQTNSFQKCIASLGYLHNESVNSYSHLLGALAFITTACFLYASVESRYASAERSDIIVFGIFFAGAALCLGMSGTYHLVQNHSPAVNKFGNKLDYLGIVCLITGSAVPSIFYGLYCHSQWFDFYMVGTAGLGFACAAASILERFRTPSWRPYRAGVFVALGLSSIIPTVHGLKFYGVQGLDERMGLRWVILQGLLYIIGAGLYAARWPERSAPGSFDIWGSSHQLFHIFVLVAAAVHLYGLTVAFDFYRVVPGNKC